MADGALVLQYVRYTVFYECIYQTWKGQLLFLNICTDFPHKMYRIIGLGQGNELHSINISFLLLNFDGIRHKQQKDHSKILLQTVKNVSFIICTGKVGFLASFQPI